MRKKLIEVALPLDEINAAGAREKSIRHGHPSTPHLWWSREPLAVARAVIFGRMVDDPSSFPEELPTPEAQTAERERVFDILRELVKWENTRYAKVLDASGEAMTVRDALAPINQILDEVLAEQEGDFGRAETLTKAKYTSVSGEGEEGAARIVRALGGAAEAAREICYRLYALADRKSRAAEALADNTLVGSWPAIAEHARSIGPAQADLLGSPSSRT